VPYERIAADTPGRQTAPWRRSGDHLYLLYTGGTTGMPKGVMWRQDDLVMVMAAQLGGGLPEMPDLEAVRALRAQPGPVLLPACPLMHGTGALTAMGALVQGGCVALLDERAFDAVELLDVVERERVNALAIVGDAFAKPILRALDANPGRWDLSSLIGITSSGVMWSEETKAGLLRHHPAMLLLDAFSSSEALGMGVSITGGEAAAKTATFQLGPDAVVVTDDGRLIEPGSDEIGMVGVGGRVPLGYYKDEEKSAATFRVIDGRRYSIPGDYATVEADGTIHLLGRGSVCINTGGEKVFPEEVEEVLKRHPSVLDAVVVGVPDERWGEAITALVEPAPGETVDEAELLGLVKSSLAPFKAPKRVLAVESIGRAPNGKVDYKRSREIAVAATA
jgi:acyl-CoA synthetase (AMP-forming)/AMP-acid ligase II